MRSFEHHPVSARSSFVAWMSWIRHLGCLDEMAVLEPGGVDKVKHKATVI